jgi:branched-subunit amino acid transport protein
MSSLEIWLAIVGLTLVTVVTRCLFLAFGDRVALPERVQHALRYAPACALVALIAPELLLHQGALAATPDNAKLVAGVVAAVAILVTRSVIATMVLGFLVFTTLRCL